MLRQRSQQNASVEEASNDRPEKPGILYVVGLPIGHLDDITLRALRLLRKADLIASEDPAATRRLLSHHGIETALTSYGPREREQKVAVLIHRLQRGARIALVSDCGSPVIADPGCLLVASAHSKGIRVVSVPGPSALTAAMAVAGLSGDSFFFQGRLPETPSRMKRCLASLLQCQTATVVFCTSASLALALRTIAKIAPRRAIVLACDMTKPGEVIIRGTARQVQRRLDDLIPAREITLILAGRRTFGREQGGKE
jgi:16S rRNA (cytidine1402-2'-O)-methyltransferase